MPSTETPEVMKRRGRVMVFAAAVAACVVDVATGGWGWSFEGTPVDQAQHEACWLRKHATPASAHDWIFTC
jgi:hypothetical protein